MQQSFASSNYLASGHSCQPCEKKPYIASANSTFEDPVVFEDSESKKKKKPPAARIELEKGSAL